MAAVSDTSKLVTNNPDEPKSGTASKSQKSRVVVWLLAYFAGGFDRFYLGQIWTGILKIITFGGFSVWTIVDLIRTAFGDRKDKHGQSLASNAKEQKVLKILTVIVLVLYVLQIPAYILFYVYVAPISNQNLQRTADITSIQNDLKAFETSVSGQLPNHSETGTSSKQIKICGKSCQNDGSVFSDLAFYKPGNISFVPYQSDFKMPDENTVYLVPDAVCNATKDGLGAPKTHDVAILYAVRTVTSISQRCADVASQSYVDHNQPPYCGLAITSTMPTTTAQFAKARIAYNKQRVTIDSEMHAAGNQATTDSIDLQLAADATFINGLQKISFQSPTAEDIHALITSLQTYDGLLSQLREDIRADTADPNTLLLNLDGVAANRQAATHAVFTDLNLPDSTCLFAGP